MVPPLQCGHTIIVSIILILPLMSGSMVLTIIMASTIGGMAVRVSSMVTMLTIVRNRSRTTWARTMWAMVSCWLFRQWGRSGQWIMRCSYRGMLHLLSWFRLGRLWGLWWWGSWRWWGWRKRGWLPHRGIHLEECLGVRKCTKGVIFCVDNQWNAQHSLLSMPEWPFLVWKITMRSKPLFHSHITHLHSISGIEKTKGAPWCSHFVCCLGPWQYSSCPCVL